MELFLLFMLVNDDRQEAQLANSIRAFGAKTPRPARGEHAVAAQRERPGLALPNRSTANFYNARNLSPRS